MAKIDLKNASDKDIVRVFSDKSGALAVAIKTGNWSIDSLKEEVDELEAELLRRLETRTVPAAPPS